MQINFGQILGLLTYTVTNSIYKDVYALIKIQIDGSGLKAAVQPSKYANRSNLLSFGRHSYDGITCFCKLTSRNEVNKTEVWVRGDSQQINKHMKHHVVTSCSSVVYGRKHQQAEGSWHALGTISELLSQV